MLGMANHGFDERCWPTERSVDSYSVNHLRLGNERVVGSALRDEVSDRDRSLIGKVQKDNACLLGLSR
jgi:hypothetical protein